MAGISSSGKGGRALPVRVRRGHAGCLTRPFLQDQGGCDLPRGCVCGVAWPAVSDAGASEQNDGQSRCRGVAEEATAKGDAGEVEPVNPEAEHRSATAAAKRRAAQPAQILIIPCLIIIIIMYN